MNKSKVVGMEQTTLADISFMSDEIQPDVVADIPVELVISPNPLGAPEPSPPSVPFPSTLPPADSPASQGNTPITAPEAGGKPLNNDVGISRPSAPTPTDSNSMMPEVVMPQLPTSASAAAPGGAWAQKKSWSQLFKPCDEGGAKQVAYVAPFNQGAEKPCEEVSIPLEAAEHKVSDTSLSEADLEKAKIGGKILFLKL